MNKVNQEIDVAAAAFKGLSYTFAFVFFYIIKKLKMFLSVFIPKINLKLQFEKEAIDKLVETLKPAICEIVRKELENDLKNINNKLSDLDKIKKATHGEAAKMDGVLIRFLDALERFEQKK